MLARPGRSILVIAGLGENRRQRANGECPVCNCTAKVRKARPVLFLLSPVHWVCLQIVALSLSLSLALLQASSRRVRLPSMSVQFHLGHSSHSLIKAFVNATYAVRTAWLNLDRYVLQLHFAEVSFLIVDAALATSSSLSTRLQPWTSLHHLLPLSLLGSHLN